ncbi:three component ABC system middle component [Pseudokineococcus sp. 5B2Z-1]|uniref:three component ABC system middle component n=1 Tax=Pseudokineococcus sp. 5B2Z-1 TaxID=3132744 RepID=UPI00403F989E
MTWSPNTSLSADLLNPSLLAVLLGETATGYAAGRDPMAWPLAFAAAPLVLHGPTRRALPKRSSQHLAAWARAHPDLLIGLPDRARSLAPPVRAGLRTALRTGLVTVDDGRLAPGPARLRRGDGALRELQLAAALVGRWLARSEQPSTVFALLGLRP